jgi:hypothetical protein
MTTATRRKTLSAVASVLTLAAAATALAADSAKNPRTLVLQPSDVPAGATRQPLGKVTSAGIVKVFTVTFNFRKGSREEEVTSDVAVAGTPADAATEYRLWVAAYTGFEGDRVIHLPSYGDEQSADYLANPERARGQLIVRKNNVVWDLTVENCGTLAPYGCAGTTPPKMTMAQALAELKKYAAKLKARVGGG